MSNVQGYKIIEKLHESSRTEVYRARHEADGRSVILKTIRGDYPGPEDLARFQKEHDFTSRLDLEWIRRVLARENDGHKPVLVYEDIGGQDLKQWLRDDHPTMGEVLDVAVRAAGMLGDLHEAGLIHKDVKPSNILYNAATGRLTIIDFGSATMLSLEDPQADGATFSGTLAYMSPEQTGRMNRGLDWRTDLYSFGVTLYELFTGRLPFESPDPLELVHAHIARLPVPPHKINPDVPPGLSGLVMKLLSKNAEDRYQSARGLESDLFHCREQMRLTGTIQPFPLAKKDVPARFTIPQKLYGRESETARLMETFNRVAHGAKKIMLVTGLPGIGKTALVREIYRPVTERRGYFVSGKFDQFQRSVPYSALTSAFRDLIRQLLTESQERLADWKDRLTASFGSIGQVIIDLVPEVELIVGPQPELPELGPTEAHNRLTYVFQNFMMVFCRAEHPLTIFLDDLQWADVASLRLIETMTTDERIGFLFLIGAYRDNEVDSAHPLIFTLGRLQDAGAAMDEIGLGPLESEDLTRLAAEALLQPVDTAAPLADLIQAKTAGNPFFVGEFLKTLHDRNLLAFDVVGRRWVWDLERLAREGITENVVDLLLGRIRTFNDRTQSVLKLASVIGARFDLEMLSIIHEKPAPETVRDLREAINDGLLQPASRGAEYIGSTGFAGQQGVEELPLPYEAREMEFKFAHDRIQQAAYALIPEEKQATFHQRVGRLILATTNDETRDEKIFDIVGQLNRGIVLLEKEDEKTELAELNLQAGKRAKTSAAWGPAYMYLQEGLNLLGESCWEIHYSLALALHEEAAEGAFINRDFDTTGRLTEKIMKQVKTKFDRIKSYEIQILASQAKGDPVAAVSITYEALNSLGVRFPKNPRKIHVLLDYITTRIALIGKRIEDLEKLPIMTDPTSLAVQRILVAGHSAAFQTSPNLFCLMGFRILRKTIRYGNSYLSTNGYNSFGIFLSGVLKNLELGYLFGKLSLAVSAQFNKGRQVAIFSQYTFMNHWKEHLDVSLANYMEGYRIGMENGDFEYAGYSIFGYFAYAFYSGKDLIDLRNDGTSRYMLLQNLKLKGHVKLHGIYLETMICFLEKKSFPWQMIGEYYNEEIDLPNSINNQDRTTVFTYYSNKLMLSYCFYDYNNTTRYYEFGKEYEDGMPCTVNVALLCFYGSLSYLMLFGDATRLNKMKIRKKINSNQKELSRYAHHAPMNFLHKYHLVEAEYHRVLSRDAKAMEYYDLAIVGAKENGYINEEALANELAALFYLSRGRDKIARVYMREARYCYQKWGALAKVAHLDENYPELLAAVPAAEPRDSSTESPSDSSSSGAALDLGSVLKATQAVTGEIHREKLLEKLVRLAMENAGAQRCLLITESPDGLVIEAEGNSDEDAVRLRRGLPVEGSRLLSSSIVHYVARTRENVLLNDATKDGRFNRDPYVLEKQPRSVLCAPLVHQDRLQAVVYLENNLTPKAFTPDRLALLRHLGAQAAIALENARLYQGLQDHAHRLEEIVAGLNLAQEVQQSLLPKCPPRLEEIDVAGRSIYCEETGGDYYGYLRLSRRDSEVLAVAVGDVSGHGVSSALLMSSVRAYLRSQAENRVRAADIVTGVNRLAAEDVEETAQFMTLFYLEIDLATHELTWVRAGHDPAVLYTPAVGTFEQLGGKGPALGLDDDWPYEQYIRTAQSGQVLILTTDGIFETHNSQGEQFGRERFNDIIRETADRPAKDIRQAVIEATAAFREDGPQEDDVTLVVIKFK